jgi:hypothetical protein
MKKSIVILTIAFLAIGTGVKAQRGKVAFNLQAGYNFQDDIAFYNAYGYIKDAFQYTGSVEYFADKYRSVEFSYTFLPTNAPLFGYTLGNQLNKGSDRVALNYIILGLNNYFPVSTTTAVHPYAGAGIGVGVASSRDGGSTYTKFAYNAKLGLLLQSPKSKIGFKLQTNIQSMVQGAGGGIYIGSGGSGVGISTYSTVLQFGFTGGLLIKLN